MDQTGRVAIDMLLSTPQTLGSAAARTTQTLPTHLTIRESAGSAPERPA